MNEIQTKLWLHVDHFLNTARGFWIVILLMIGLGFAAGYRLSALPRFEPYKLLNIAGLSYSLLGVLALSEMLASGTWKKVCVTILAPTIGYLQMALPLGAFIGSSSLGHLMDKPSWAIVAKFSISFFAYSMIPGALFTEVVVFPQLPIVKKDVETRWKWFGFFLILSGVAVQLVAALLAL